MKVKSSQRASARVLHQQQQRSQIKASSILIVFVSTVLVVWLITVYYSKSSMKVVYSQENTKSLGSVKEIVVKIPTPLRSTIPASAELHPVKSSTTKKMKVAYAITLTKDGFFQDCAAVLAYSIYNVSKGMHC
jgi:hypothetical protein